MISHLIRILVISSVLVVGDTLGYPVLIVGDPLGVWLGYFGLSCLVRDTLVYPIWLGYFGFSCLVRIIWFIWFVACLCLLLRDDLLPHAFCCLHQLVIALMFYYFFLLQFKLSRFHCLNCEGVLVIH